MRFVIPDRLPSLNEYIQAERSNRQYGARMKRDYQKCVCNAIDRALEYNRLRPIESGEYPIHITIKWYEENNRRDIDNITFATKFILDAMVERGIIKDDSRRYVYAISHEVYTDKVNPRIEVYPQ